MKANLSQFRMRFREISRTSLNSDFKYKSIFLIFSILSLLVRFRLTWRNDTRNFSIENFRIVSDAGNFDLGSWFIIMKSFESGKTPWDSGRYNYGPSWGALLWLVDKISFDNFQARLLIVLILFLFDLATALILVKFNKRILAVLYLLNPISLTISGYHNQIETSAIFFVLLSMYIYSNQAAKGDSNKRIWIVAVLIGISLTFKHSFFILPIWLALRESKIVARLIFLIVPYLIFIVSFLPFWGQSNTAIIQNVIRYRSYQNFPLYANFFDLTKVDLVYFNLTFVLGLIALGFLARKYSPLNSLALLSISIVALAPSMANQYLVLAAFGAILIGGRISYFFLFLATLFLCKNPDGLGIPQFGFVNISYSLLALVLFCMIINFFRNLPGVKLDLKKNDQIFTGENSKNTLSF
jgi:hypothetical protein